MSAKPARHLRVVDTKGEVFECGSPEETIRALEAALTRAQKTIDALRADKAAERKSYMRRALIEDAFMDWREKLVVAGQKGKARCKLSDDRFDAMKAMAEAGYTLEDFRLVNTGIAEFQFVVYGKRRATGPEADRQVDIAFACEKARRFEEAARLGAIVEKARAPRS
jgi:flavin-binding protein dodecin